MTSEVVMFVSTFSYGTSTMPRRVQTVGEDELPVDVRRFVAHSIELNAAPSQAAAAARP
jgi:hypothetical protein